jgi:hypothetical protein
VVTKDIKSAQVAPALINATTVSKSVLLIFDLQIPAPKKLAKPLLVGSALNQGTASGSESLLQCRLGKQHGDDRLPHPKQLLLWVSAITLKRSACVALPTLGLVRKLDLAGGTWANESPHVRAMDNTPRDGCRKSDFHSASCPHLCKLRVIPVGRNRYDLSDPEIDYSGKPVVSTRIGGENGRFQNPLAKLVLVVAKISGSSTATVVL